VIYGTLCDRKMKCATGADEKMYAERCNICKQQRESVQKGVRYFVTEV